MDLISIIKNYIRNLLVNKGLVLDILVIGLIIGALTQAYVDYKGIDELLKSNADIPNRLVHFGDNFYTLHQVNLSEVSDFDLSNITILNNSQCGGSP